VLARGFALVRDGKGRIVRGVNELAPDALIRVGLVDGTLEARVTTVQAVNGADDPDRDPARAPASAPSPP
jgi:exonuclease VII large subunit